MTLINGLKFSLLKRMSQSLLFFVEFRARRSSSDKHRGQDPALDRCLKYLSIREIYGFVPDGSVDGDHSPSIVAQIEASIDQSAHEEISSIKDRAGRYLPFLKRIVANEPVDLRTIHLLPLSWTICAIRRKGKVHYRYFKYLHTQKASFSVDHILKFLALLTPLLLLGGILKQLILASEFGFSPDDVFVIGDYVSSSISTLTSAVIPLVLMLILGSIAYIADTGQDRITSLREAAKGRRDFRVTYVILSVAAIVLFLVDHKSLYFLLPYAIVISLFQILPTLLRRYFKNSLQIYVLSAFSLLFFANVATTTIQSADQIRNSNIPGRYLFILEQPTPAKASDLRYVTTGSKFVVFYDVATGQTILLTGC